MYETHWQLTKRPFESGADPAAYYPSEAHQAALLKLRYALDQRSGAALLAGGAGSGKTLLVRLIDQRAGSSLAPIVHLVYPQMPAGDLLAYLAAELGETRPGEQPRGMDESVRAIARTLAENVRRGRHAVIVIDEAHLIGGAHSWEALRLLLNFETDGTPDLTLLVVGQPTLLPVLSRMPQWEERLAVKCLLRPFNADETASYVEHRLTLAGSKQPIFTSAALETVHRLTRGMPRRINRLCDLALLLGFADEQTSIGPEQIEAVGEELEIITAD